MSIVCRSDSAGIVLNTHTDVDLSKLIRGRSLSMGYVEDGDVFVIIGGHDEGDIFTVMSMDSLESMVHRLKNTRAN